MVGLIYYPALAAVVLKDEDVSIMSWDRVKVTGVLMMMMMSENVTTVLTLMRAETMLTTRAR